MWRGAATGRRQEMHDPASSRQGLEIRARQNHLDQACLAAEDFCPKLGLRIDAEAMLLVDASRPRIVFHEIEPQLTGAKLCERVLYNQRDRRLQ